MPTLSNASDFEDDDIVAEYERQDSDRDQLNVDRDEDPGSGNEENKEPHGTRRIDPSTSKQYTVRNPIPKLNTERLKGPKGIQTIEKYFEGFKFHGKGYEKLDLDRIMTRMEHWGHRLFPKLEFDDFLSRTEKLGTKKDLQVFIKKYRLDMITEDDIATVKDIEDEENNKEQDEPIDEFDLLIAEQIEKQKEVINQQSSTFNTSEADALFEKLFSQTTSKSSQPVQDNSHPSQLGDEVKERIERNRQEAIRRKLARLKAMENETNKKILEEVKDTRSQNVSGNLQIPSEPDKKKLKEAKDAQSEDSSCNLQIPSEPDKKKLKEAKDTQSEDGSCNLQIPSEPDKEKLKEAEDTQSENGSCNLQIPSEPNKMKLKEAKDTQSEDGSCNLQIPSEIDKKKLEETKGTQSEGSSCSVQIPSETSNFENKNFKNNLQEVDQHHEP